MQGRTGPRTRVEPRSRIGGRVRRFRCGRKGSGFGARKGRREHTRPVAGGPAGMAAGAQAALRRRAARRFARRGKAAEPCAQKRRCGRRPDFVICALLIPASATSEPSRGLSAQQRRDLRSRLRSVKRVLRATGRRCRSLRATPRRGGSLRRRGGRFPASAGRRAPAPPPNPRRCSQDAVAGVTPGRRTWSGRQQHPNRPSRLPGWRTAGSPSAAR